MRALRPSVTSLNRLVLALSLLASGTGWSAPVQNSYSASGAAHYLKYATQRSKKSGFQENKNYEGFRFAVQNLGAGKLVIYVSYYDPTGTKLLQKSLGIGVSGGKTMGQLSETVVTQFRKFHSEIELEVLKHLSELRLPDGVARPNQAQVKAVFAGKLLEALDLGASRIQLGSTAESKAFGNALALLARDAYNSFKGDAIRKATAAVESLANEAKKDALAYQQGALERAEKRGFVEGQLFGGYALSVPQPDGRGSVAINLSFPTQEGPAAFAQDFQVSVEPALDANGRTEQVRTKARAMAAELKKKVAAYAQNSDEALFGGADAVALDMNVIALNALIAALDVAMSKIPKDDAEKLELIRLISIAQRELATELNRIAPASPAGEGSGEDPSFDPGTSGAASASVNASDRAISPAVGF